MGPDELAWVPVREVRRVLGLDLPAALRTQMLADLCRINVLYMIGRAGSGHIGTSFSSLDLLAWLFLDEMQLPSSDVPTAPGDRFFSSKGHDAPALYALLIALERLPEKLLHRLRRHDGLPGHPDVSTPGIETNTGSLGMGISKAKGMVLADRLAHRSGRIFVLTGDGELQEGQIWESLLSAANLRLGEITVLVDHNKLQSDTWVEAVSALGDLEARFASFGWAVARCDGHDPTALATALEACSRKSDQPRVLIADTTKGRGVTFMEPAPRSTELYRFHSGAPSPEDQARALQELLGRVNQQLREHGAPELEIESLKRDPPRSIAKPQRLIDAYSNALVEAASGDLRVVALDGDLVLDTGLIPFRDKFPDRFFECGIAEQDMVSIAGGMALRGLRPVVHSFACFLSARPCEQIYNNATERTQIVYVGSLAGLLPAGTGHSHQGVRDIAVLGGIPGMLMVQPSCESEVGPLLDYCLRQHRGPSYLRLVSIPCEVPFSPPAGIPLPGRGTSLTSGEDALLLSHGPVLLGEGVKAARQLAAERDLGVRVVNLPWLNHVDAEWLSSEARGARAVFALDDHYVVGGQGDRIAAALAAARVQTPPLTQLGVQDIPACGTNQETLRAHRLDAESLADTIWRTLRER